MSFGRLTAPSWSGGGELDDRIFIVVSGARQESEKKVELNIFGGRKEEYGDGDEEEEKITPGVCVWTWNLAVYMSMICLLCVCVCVCVSGGLCVVCVLGGGAWVSGLCAYEIFYGGRRRVREPIVLDAFCVCVPVFAQQHCETLFFCVLSPSSWRLWRWNIRRRKQERNRKECAKERTQGAFIDSLLIHLI